MRIQNIRFRQSGGFAGLVRGCDAAPGDLGAADLEALARHARAQTAETPAAAASAARDLVVYEIELETDCGVKRLEFDEMHVPPDLASLVERFVEHARPMPL